MIITWCRTEVRQEALDGEGICQKQTARMTIDQDDAIVHPFILRQFLPNTAARRIILNGRLSRSSSG